MHVLCFHLTKGWKTLFVVDLFLHSFPSVLPQLLASFVAQLSIEPFTIISMAIIIELCQNSCDPKRMQTYICAPRHVQIMTICSSGPTLWIINSFDCCRAEVSQARRCCRALTREGRRRGRGVRDRRWRRWRGRSSELGAGNSGLYLQFATCSHRLRLYLYFWLDSLSQRVTLRNTLALLPWNLKRIARCGPGHCLSGQW